MKCPLCKGNMVDGQTEIKLRRGKRIVVVDNVPGLVCDQCGEASLDQATSQRVYDMANKAWPDTDGVAEFIDYNAA